MQLLCSAPSGEGALDDRGIHDRDLSWLQQSDGGVTSCLTSVWALPCE